MKQIIIFIVIFTLLSCNINSNTNTNTNDTIQEIESLENEYFENDKIDTEINYMDIEGIYIDNHGNNGLKIELLRDGNYKFSYVFMDNSNTLFFSETATAYVIKKPGNNPNYIYYWHTGRYRDIPDSDSIIVYDIVINGTVIEGVYFFPENPNNTSDGTIRYIKNRFITD